MTIYYRIINNHLYLTTWKICYFENFLIDHIFMSVTFKRNFFFYKKLPFFCHKSSKNTTSSFDIGSFPNFRSWHFLETLDRLIQKYVWAKQDDTINLIKYFIKNYEQALHQFKWSERENIIFVTSQRFIDWEKIFWRS